MAGTGPHQAGSHQSKPARSQPQGTFPNPERGRNKENGKFREGSAHTTQISGSRTHGQSHVLRRRNDDQTMQSEEVKSHVSKRQDDKAAMQREIDDLKRELRHAQWRRSHPSTDTP